MLGLAFKAGTDDVRESRAFPIVDRLLQEGASVRVHDPVALANFRREWPRQSSSSPPTFCGTVEQSLRGADLAVLQADWAEYLRWPARWSRMMRSPLVVDLRRALTVSTRKRAGLRVVALGRGHGVPSRGPGASPKVAKGDA